MKQQGFLIHKSKREATIWFQKHCNFRITMYSASSIYLVRWSIGQATNETDITFCFRFFYFQFKTSLAWRKRPTIDVISDLSIFLSCKKSINAFLIFFYLSPSILKKPTTHNLKKVTQFCPSGSKAFLKTCLRSISLSDHGLTELY